MAYLYIQIENALTYKLIKVLLISVGKRLNTDPTFTEEITRKDESRHKRMDIKEVRKSYAEGFTIHGLSKIFTGHPVERVFWFVCLMTVLSFTGFMCHYYQTIYQEKDIRTEIRVVEKDELQLPVVTVCNPKSLYCHENRSLLKPEWNEACGVKEVKIGETVDGQFKSKTLNLSGCINFNVDGKLWQKGKNELKMDISVYNEDYKAISLFHVSNHKNFKQYPTMQQHLTRWKINLIDIQEITAVQRLPSPYPSKCSNGEGLNNFFSSVYNQASCVESCFLQDMLDDCRTVIDRWKKLLTPMMRKQMVISSNYSTKQCLIKHLNHLNRGQNPPRCNCPLSCTEVMYTVHALDGRTDDHQRHGAIEHKIKYRSMQQTDITEIPAYSMSTMMAEIGGLVGVLSGVSVLSVIELACYISLCLVSLWKAVF